MSGTEQTLNICSHGYCFLKTATLTEFPSTATKQPHTVIGGNKIDKKTGAVHIFLRL